MVQALLGQSTNTLIRTDPLSTAIRAAVLDQFEGSVQFGSNSGAFGIVVQLNALNAIREVTGFFRSIGAVFECYDA